MKVYQQGYLYRKLFIFEFRWYSQRRSRDMISQDLVSHFAWRHQVVIRRSIKFTIDIEAWKTTCLNLQPISHYDDVIMGAITSQITSLTIVYSAVYSDADQSKHQSSASLAFVWGIHRGPVNSAHKWPITRKRFPFDDVIMMPANGITNFIQIAIKIWYFFRKMHFEMLSAICRPFCSDCSMLIIRHCYIQLMDVAREI